MTGHTTIQMSPAVVIQTTTVPVSSALPSNSTDILTASSVTIAPASSLANATMLNTSDTSNTELFKMFASYEELSKKKNSVLYTAVNSMYTATRVLTADPGPVWWALRSVAQPVCDGMVSLRDLSYLQRREFKVQGGQIGDHSSDISYNNVCKQVEEGTKKGFTDTNKQTKL